MPDGGHRLPGLARIQIIDCRLGNLFSVRQACLKAGLDAFVSSSVETLDEVDGIILPGVGAFGHAMQNLQELKLIEPLIRVVREGKPLLGICLGMQLLFDESEEFGTNSGLGLIAGHVRRLPDQTTSSARLRVPNVGWHHVELSPQKMHEPVSQVIRNGAYMYFVHSYRVIPNEESDILTFTEYGQLRYCSAVQRKNIIGVQFHPERSAKDGIQFYRNWAALIQRTSENDRLIELPVGTR